MESRMLGSNESLVNSPLTRDVSQLNEMAGLNLPYLRIIHQACVAHEHFSKNAISKEVHIVVKNVVFLVEVTSNVDLSKSHIEAKLLYDFDREEDQKLEVSYVKNEPLEYKVNILDSGTKATIELRIKVLTSQHEDMLFRVQLKGIDPLSGREFETYTQPIKVISKLTQLKKSSNSNAINIGINNPKKRVSNDQIISILNRLESQQIEQRNFLQMILAKLYGIDSPISQSNNDQTIHSLSNFIPPQTLTTSSSEDFSTSNGSLVNELQQSQRKEEDEDYKHREAEGALWKFISSFDDLPPDQKREKIKGFLQHTSGVVTEKLSEFFDVFDNNVRKKLKTTKESTIHGK
jgi:hypothetical protein